MSHVGESVTDIISVRRETVQLYKVQFVSHSRITIHQHKIYGLIIHYLQYLK